MPAQLGPYDIPVDHPCADLRSASPINSCSRTCSRICVLLVRRMHNGQIELQPYETRAWSVHDPQRCTVVCNPTGLAASTDVRIVGFFGERRRDSDTGSDRSTRAPTPRTTPRVSRRAELFVDRTGRRLLGEYGGPHRRRRPRGGEMAGSTARQLRTLHPITGRCESITACCTGCLQLEHNPIAAHQILGLARSRRAPRCGRRSANLDDRVRRWRLATPGTRRRGRLLEATRDGEDRRQRSTTRSRRCTR